MLFCEKSGRGDQVVLIHGFTQSGRSWGEIAARLVERHHVVTVDLPGHGRSAAVTTGLWDGARLLAEVAGRGSYVGYSMGGRFALHVALARPQLVTRLVVVSTTAGLDDAGQRAARRVSDEALAQQVERDGVEAFVTSWLHQPLFASLPPGAAAIDSRLHTTAAGLAASLRRCGTGAQEPLWDQVRSLRMPVLAIAGGLDGAYVERAERLVKAIGPNATLVVIPNAGHACHLERPDQFFEAVSPFLAAHGKAMPRA